MRQRQLADLVEEQRAAVGQLEQAGAVAATAPVNAPLLVAEQLALDQRLGQRRAVDLHERAGRARASRAWTRCATSSLPTPVSPEQQHRQVRGRHRCRSRARSRCIAGARAQQLARGAARACHARAAACSRAGRVRSMARMASTASMPRLDHAQHGLQLRSDDTASSACGAAAHPASAGPRARRSRAAARPRSRAPAAGRAGPRPGRRRGRAGRSRARSAASAALASMRARRGCAAASKRRPSASTLRPSTATRREHTGICRRSSAIASQGTSCRRAGKQLVVAGGERHAEKGRRPWSFRLRGVVAADNGHSWSIGPQHAKIPRCRQGLAASPWQLARIFTQGHTRRKKHDAPRTDHLP